MCSRNMDAVAEFPSRGSKNRDTRSIHSRRNMSSPFLPEACRVSDTDLYRVTRVIEHLEGITPTQAGSRWVVIKSRGTVPFIKHGTTLCVRDRDIELIVRELRECPNKTNALAALGVEPDNSKVREVVLHADGQEVRIEVCSGPGRTGIESRRSISRHRRCL